MRNLILLLLLPLCSYSQDINTALDFHNLLRSYYDMKPLKHSSMLDNVAQEKADEIAEKQRIFFDTFDDYGQSVFSTDNFSFGRDYYLEASIGWTVGGARDTTLSQILCDECSEIGFGLSISDEKVYIVAIYDKMFY